MNQLCSTTFDALICHVRLNGDSTKTAFESLKPGAHALFRGSPTDSHLVNISVEDAGFAIKDIITHFHEFGHEFWTLARKPSDETLADNLLKHRVGGINIDACRIGYSSKSAMPQKSKIVDFRGTNFNPNNGKAKAKKHIEGKIYVPNELGRWPSNAIFSHASNCGPNGCADACPVLRLTVECPVKNASRFFYCSYEPIKTYLVKLITPPNGKLVEISE